MTITVPGMRSNKLMSMDIDQLRGWAAFMDRAMIVSLAAVILAIAALGITTWLSFRFGGAVRSHEQATLDRYKAMEIQSAERERDAVAARDRAVALEQQMSAARERTVALEQEIAARQGRAATLEQEVSTTRERTVALEKEVSAARERTMALEQQIAARQGRAVTLEQEVSATRARTVELEQEVTAARERTARLEQEAATARERAVAFEQAAREANERVARTARESAAASEKAKAPQFDAAEIQQRLADLGKLVREAAARPPDPAPESGAEAPRPVSGQGSSESAAASREAQPSPIVSGLRKYAGTKAAVFVLHPVSDAAAVGATISAYLGDAGWAPQTWTWTGVAGIFGVVVLLKEGSDPETNEAASALVDALRSAGMNVTKGDWPADWRRYRGTLDGPQTPPPTEAPIRIVIGAKPR